MFNPNYYYNSLEGGISVLEIVSGDGEKDPSRLFVPLKRTELKGEVTGPLASLHLCQTYSYSKEQCDKVLEAFYRFPLPGDAAVTQVRVSFGDVEIKAELKERQKAEADYEERRSNLRHEAISRPKSRLNPRLFADGCSPFRRGFTEK